MKKYKINFPINGNPYDYYVNDNYDLMNSKKRLQKGYDYNCNMDFSVYDKQPYMPIGGTPIQMPNNKYHDCDKDREYMKEMYPNLCKKIQRLVDEECDRMEYDGSYMYDEYPDREAIEMITDKIYDQMNMEEKNYLKEVENEENIEANQSRNIELRDLIKVILLNEMFNRRNRKYNRPYRNNRNYNRYYNPYDYSNYYYNNIPYGYYF